MKKFEYRENLKESFRRVYVDIMRSGRLDKVELLKHINKSNTNNPIKSIEDIPYNDKSHLYWEKLKKLYW